MLARSHQLAALSVSQVANRIAWARLAYLDGVAARSEFPLSGSAHFLPGRQVEILAGAGRQQDLLFRGLVVKHGLRVRQHAAPQLIVECRHAAMKLTVARRDACHVALTDGEIIENLLANAGLDAQVEATGVRHEQMVQFHASDWDFLVARARANGLLVHTHPDGVRVAAPAQEAPAAIELLYGATLLELDAEVDARQQYAAVRGVSWDAAGQAVVQAEGTPPSDTGLGDLAPDDLAAVAGAQDLELRHSALGAAEMQAWADATGRRARLDKVGGRAQCEGTGRVRAGDVVALDGLGSRFSGTALVTGVRHEFDLVGGWKTHIQFGGLEPPEPAGTGVCGAPAAGGGLIPAAAGLQVGVVTSNEDPAGEHRVRVRLPLVDAQGDGLWARVANPDAGDGRGFFFRPEMGDEVVVGFFDADPRHPVILGMLHGSARPAPLAGSDANGEKAYVSRSGMRLLFDDERREMRLETPAGNILSLSEADAALVLADQHGNRITLDSAGIRLESVQALGLASGTGLSCEAGTDLSLKSATQLKLEGGAGAELSSAGVTRVAGSLVQIN